MKKLFTLLSVLFLGLMAVSCYDDTAVLEKLADHENRIKTLETQCQQMNENIKAVKALAESAGKQISSVDPIKDGDAEIGYTITFTDGTSIKVYHGQDGANGTDGTDGKDGADAQAPQIGAAAEDGVLYWTLNGEWLLDPTGNKIPVVGKDAVAPQLKIADGMWYVSYDAGKTWTAVGSASADGSVDSMFDDITFDENYVYFTLSSGETLAVPRVKSFDIVFSNEEVSFFPGEECLVEYTLVGADEYSQVKAFGPEGWTVNVLPNEADPAKGYIKVVSPLQFQDGNVTVLVSDGRSKTFLRTLVFTSGEFVAPVYTHYVDADDTSLDINFSTNFNYWVYATADWITLPETKSEMRDETISITLTENTSYEPRGGYVQIVSMNGYVIADFLVYQYGKVYDAWYIVGGFNDWTCADENYKMTYENDMFVYKNFETTGTELKFNIGSWDVERTARFMCADYGALMEDFGDNMEVPAGKYDVYMDKNATIVYFMTAGKTPEDQLEAYDLESGQYWIVAGGTWSGFSQVVAGPLAEDASYGYLPAETPGENEWYGLSSTMKNAYTFTELEEGGFTIQDSYGRYLYQIEKYNSYNVSYELPTEGYVWDVYQQNDYGYTTIVNRDTGKIILFETLYGTFGCYADFSEGARYYPYLVKAENPLEEQEPEPVVTWGVIGNLVDNLWESDFAMTQEGEWLVAKGVQFTELTFKIRGNGTWDDATNIGFAPDTEKGLVNAELSVVTAEYAKANYGGDAADIKLNGPAGTYDVYFSYEDMVVYVMEPGYKPGEREPVQAEPAEVTYTVVGTLNGINWNNSAPEGLMTLQGDYYVAENVPFVTAATLYGGAEQFEFKIVETGTWNGYGVVAGTAAASANAEIALVMGGENIPVVASEGNYDVYFDKTNAKVWVMTPGTKPGYEAPEEPETPELTPSEWGVVGTLNSWGGSPDIQMYEVDGMYVAYDVVFDQSENKFKIRANNQWDDTANYGLATAGSIEPDHYYSVVCGGNSGDMTVPAGTYDIWFDRTNEVVYLMTPDNSISNAVAGGTSEPEEPAYSNWYLVGSFNDWTVADPEYQMTEEADCYVFYGFTAEVDVELKFNAGDWSVNRGGDGFVEGEYMPVYQGGANIMVPAGKYDILLTKDASMVSFVRYTTGDTPATETRTLTNEEICAAMTSSETSYGEYTISSASGVWTVNASQLNSNTFLQCRGRKGSYIMTPLFEKDIKSVTIHFTDKKSVYADNVYCAFPASWTVPTEDAAYPEDGNVGRAVTDGSYSVTIPVEDGNKQVYVSIIGTYSYYVDHIDVEL